MLIGVRIRDGGLSDTPAVLALFDEAVLWLVENGRSGQWGTEPFTGNARREEHARKRATSGGMRVAEDEDGTVLGVIVITGQHQEYIPAVDEPEVYVNLLLTSRRHRGRGVGAALLDRARAEAAERGVDLLRVDCYAGGDGKLIRYYESMGFTPVREFTVGKWPGQLLQLRLSESEG